MTELESRLRSTFADHQDSVRVDRGLLNDAIRRGNRRVHRRRALAGVAAMVAIIGSAAGLRSFGDEAGSHVVSTSGIGHWAPVDISDPGIFSGDGDTFISAVTSWEDQVVVLGVLQSSGDNVVLAWTSRNGIDWERRELDWPTGCDPYGGLVNRGDQLIVACESIGGDDLAALDVATTTDLEEWTVHRVAGGGNWFGSLIGAGPGDTVIFQALEAADPNTTVGARTRVWSSSDLMVWTEMTGDTAETFLDGSANAIRTLDEVTIITGIVNEWPADVGPTTPAVMRPAVWVSTSGGPFRRTILDAGDPAAGLDGAALDVAATGDGFVAVGSAGAGSIGLAWYSTDLTNWTKITVATPRADQDVSTQNGLWAVIGRSDGTLLAVGDGTDLDGRTTIAWQSTDDGRSWRSVGPGPSLLADWDGKPVGMSTFPDPGVFWTWDLQS